MKSWLQINIDLDHKNQILFTIESGQTLDLRKIARV